MINFLTNLIVTICESNTILDNITSLGMSDEAYYSYKKAEQAQKTVAGKPKQQPGANRRGAAL